MEQLILILAVLAALSGFGMGLMNLAGPYLKRRKISLPSIALPQFNLSTLLRRGEAETEDDDFDLEDEDDISAARDFAENSFAAGSSLLADRRTAFEDDDEEELDEELDGVLDHVASEEPAFEDVDEAEEENLAIYTVPAEADATEGEPSEDDLDDADEDEDGDEYEDDDEEEATEPEIQVVAAVGDDMLSLFDESADDVAKVLQAWREDLPEVTIEELLADARAIRQQISGNKPNAA